jgi:intein/homing endonuclease
MEIESGMSWIEDPIDLKLIIDNLKFEDIEELSVEKVEKELVYDLEVDTQHNYIVEGLGMVHNGGGK